MNTSHSFLKFACTLFLSSLLAINTAQATEAPDALIKRISSDVLNEVNTNPDIQKGDTKKISALVETKILPHVDFEKMTMLAMGRYWREASATQRKKITEEFRNLLIYTYAGAVAQAKNNRIEFQPSRMIPTESEAEIRSQVLRPRGEPIQLNYRLQKQADQWKIYDVNVMGVWLVESYKGSFGSEIQKGGIDNLIISLQNKNQKIAEKTAQNK